MDLGDVFPLRPPVLGGFRGWGSPSPMIRYHGFLDETLLLILTTLIKLYLEYNLEHRLNS